MDHTRETVEPRFARFFQEAATNADELATFRDKSLWMSDDRLVNDLTSFLGPHAEDYFSPLRSLFLHQIRSPRIVQYFSPILARDGLLSLLYFFHQNRKPSFDDTLLLVHGKLSDLVPEAWRDNVAYYGVESVSGGTHAIAAVAPATDIKRLFLLLTIIDERHCSYAYLESVLDKIVRFYSDRLPQISFHCVVLPGGIFPGKSGDQVAAKIEYSFRAFQTIVAKLGPAVKWCKWEDVKVMNLNNSAFVDLNELNFYYSDSYVVQHFLSRGSVPSGVTCEDGKRGTHRVDLSFYHRYAIDLGWSSSGGSFGEKWRRIERKIDDFFGTRFMWAFEKKEALSGKSGFFPPWFDEIAYEVGRELLLKVDRN